VMATRTEPSTLKADEIDGVRVPGVKLRRPCDRADTSTETDI